MKKIPRDVELSIRRTMPVDHEWTMSEFLNKLREELLFRGMDEATPRVQSSREEKNPNKGRHLLFHQMHLVLFVLEITVVLMFCCH